MCFEGDEKVIRSIEDKMESPDFDSPEHHPYCPARWKGAGIHTLCRCLELRKADRDAAAEEKWERSQDK